MNLAFHQRTASGRLSNATKRKSSISRMVPDVEMFTGDGRNIMSSSFRSSMNFMKSAEAREALSTARLADSRVVNQTVRDFNNAEK